MLIVFSCYKLRWNKAAFDNSWCSHRGHSFCDRVRPRQFVLCESRNSIQSEKTKEKKRKTHTQQTKTATITVTWGLTIYSKLHLRLYSPNNVEGWFRTNLWYSWKRIPPMSYLCRWGTMSQLYDCISLLPCHFSFQPMRFSVPWDVGIQRLQWKGGTEEWKKDTREILFLKIWNFESSQYYM